jgi:hypothetical protein
MTLFLRAVRGHRWVAAVLAVLVGVGAIVGYVAIPWTYNAQAEVILLPSQIVAKQTGGNPYLSFASSLVISAEVVGQRLMDDQAVADMHGGGFTSTYTVGVAPDSTGPVLTVTVTGSDQRNILATMNALISGIDNQLTSLQSGLDPAARITPSLVGASAHPRRVHRPKIETLAEIVIVMAGLSAGLLMLLQMRADSAGDPDASEADSDELLRSLEAQRSV